jgi:hypothetical protein
VLGLDTDIGGEFINTDLLTYYEQEQISFTRGHAYEKNDECFVEQMNGAAVRQFVGYDRYEGADRRYGRAAGGRAVRFAANACGLTQTRTPSAAPAVPIVRQKRAYHRKHPALPRWWRSRVDPFAEVWTESVGVPPPSLRD